MKCEGIEVGLPCPSGGAARAWVDTAAQKIPAYTTVQAFRTAPSMLGSQPSNQQGRDRAKECQKSVGKLNYVTPEPEFPR